MVAKEFALNMCSLWRKIKDKTTKNNGELIAKIRKIVLTSSTCSVVKGPPYFDLPRSILEGISSSKYVRALRFRGTLCLAANFRML